MTPKSFVWQILVFYYKWNNYTGHVFRLQLGNYLLSILCLFLLSNIFMLHHARADEPHQKDQRLAPKKDK